MAKDEQVILRKTPWEKGETPEHLKPFTDKLAKASRECAKQADNDDLEGMDKVNSINACVSKKLKDFNEELQSRISKEEENE